MIYHTVGRNIGSDKSKKGLSHLARPKKTEKKNKNVSNTQKMQMRQFKVEILRISSILWSFSTAVSFLSTYINTPSGRKTTLLPEICLALIKLFEAVSNFHLRQPQVMFDFI